MHKSMKNILIIYQSVSPKQTIFLKKLKFFQWHVQDQCFLEQMPSYKVKHLFTEKKIIQCFSLFCQFINLLMNKDEDDIIGPILFVKNIPDQGLRISWNLTGIIFNNDYQNYHLFVPVASQFKLFQQFFNCYYSNLRLGDLVGICKDDQGPGQRKKIKWTQKTALGIEKNFLKQKYIWKDIQMQKLDQLLNKVKKFNGLVIVNIFFQSKSNIQKSITRLKQKIIQVRKIDPDMDKVVINVVSDYYCESMLNSIEGLNYFFFQQQNVNHTIQQIINYLKILKLKKLKIRIYFNQNFNFSLGNNSDWRASENSFIEKVYYSVPNCRFNEYFIFLLRSQGVQIDIDITIVLSCSMYNGTQIKAKNNVIFKTNSNAHKAKTWNYYNKQLLGVTKLPNKDSIMSSFGEKYNQIWIFKDSQQ